MSLNVEIDKLKKSLEGLCFLGKRILEASNNQMYSLDFPMIGAVKRSLNIGTGLIELVQSKNMVCSRALVRMQIDTVSRLLAYTYVDNPGTMAKEITGGKKLSQFSSRDNKKLKDHYLVSKMTEKYQWTQDVYEKTCNDIHFTEKQFFDSISVLNSNSNSNSNYTIRLHLSATDDKFPDSSWYEIISCFNKLLEILETTIESYVQEKNHSATSN